MSKILLGKPVADEISQFVKTKAEILIKKNIVPTLATIRLGINPQDIAYEKSAIKRMELCGIKTQVNVLDKYATTEELLDILQQKNTDKNVHGILVFQPMPVHIDSECIKNSISRLKDVDCINPVSSSKIYLENKNALIPATPGAVIEILDYYNISLSGRNIAVLGRSMVVGKPLAMMLLSRNATVTICHSKTKNIEKVCKTSEIIISCIGKARFVDKNFVNSDSIVIDVGINMDENSKICGDVNFGNVESIVSAITPVPGGVGAVTTSVLARNVVYAAELLGR